ncbi:MAG TPA: hypothetical protein VH134_13950 [Candidatus Dormibacteraeota bacterium]|jgi:hypothetical protein|nr:hypothetical protein [Candidatus Dormibacteraeota bacterium]
MLSTAVREMNRAAHADERARTARAAKRADLTRAEEYAVQVEDLVELDRRTIPESLLLEIRRFVRGYSRRLATSLGTQPPPARTLDVLFDVQERIQQRMTDGLASAA